MANKDLKQDYAFVPFRVVRKDFESAVIVSFYLEPVDHQISLDFLAGQYISVRIPLSDGEFVERFYSLSNAPGQGVYRISVKREVKATGVSAIMHEILDVGQVIDVSLPRGDFNLNVSYDDKRPLVLLGAGVGVTPVLSMLLSAVRNMPERQIIFIHASLHENDHAFKGEVDDLMAQYNNLNVYYRYSDDAPDGVERDDAQNVSVGFVDDDFVRSVMGDIDGEYYFCGPQPFMINVYRALKSRGVDDAFIHYESFGSSNDLAKLV